MPTIVIERPNLPVEMRDALKKHILRERQKKKEEADANEADKQRRREEKAKALSSSKVQLADNAKDICNLQRTIEDLKKQKDEQYNLLKRALTEEDRRKHSQQTLTKEPSWSSLYPPHFQMAQYAHHPQHYLSAQPSHRLLAYKPPPQPPQPQSFIPTTSATNINSKRSRSPTSSNHYSSPSGKSLRTSHVSQMRSRPTSPGSRYPLPSSQIARNGAPGSSAIGYPSPQAQSPFSFFDYMRPSSAAAAAAAAAAASYANQVPRVRGSSQMTNYLNSLQYLTPSIVTPNQQPANIYPPHQLLIPPKNGSIMNGYPSQPQQ